VPSTAQAAPPFEGAPDKAAVVERGEVLELSWEDAEEHLEGSISPASARPGDTLEIHVDLRPFEGPPLDTPVQISLRGPSGQSEEKVAIRGERDWRVSLPTHEPGRHTLDIRYRGTRLKVVHAELWIGASPLERFWKLVIPFVLALVMGGWTLRRLRRARLSSRSAEAPAELPPGGDAP
jgi:hypothetical protein